MSVSNPDSSDSKINIINSGEDISINCINPLESSIQFDEHDILLSFKTLQVFKQASLLEFNPILKSVSSNDYMSLGKFNTNIELNLKLSLKRPAIFGF